MDLCSDEVGENSERKDSNIKMVSKDQQCLPVYMPCAPFSACTPRLINLPFPNEFNWSYTGRNYDEQVPVVPAKKRKVETEENKNEPTIKEDNPVGFLSKRNYPFKAPKNKNKILPAPYLKKKIFATNKNKAIMTQRNSFFPINNTWSLTIACPPNLPPLGEYNWNYGKYVEPPGYDNCDNFAGCGSTYFQQPRRRRAIRPRSWFGRQIGPPESATTYNCSFYKKCYSKRCPIWLRNQLQRSYAPPPRCTMNQLSYTYRLKHNM